MRSLIRFAFAPRAAKAATVKDTLEVSDKLNDVRGAIEDRQAEFEALSKQVETAASDKNKNQDEERAGSCQDDPTRKQQRHPKAPASLSLTAIVLQEEKPMY